jgi:electron transfer flavoprotein beta subunit
MKIIVCIKQVIDTAARIRITDGKVDAAGSPRVINPYDEFAIEEAIRIREKLPETEVIALTLGPEGFKDALKTALAMGADRAIHLIDPAFDGLDNLGVARALAKAIRKLSFDLILCGRQAVDDDMAQVGPAIAVFLGIPAVAVVTQVDLSEDLRLADVTRQIEGGSEKLVAQLPLLLTCQKGLNQPRLPSLKGIIASKKKPVETMDANAIGFDPAEEGEPVNRVNEIELNLPQERKKGRILAGSPREAVATLAQLLRDEERVI